MLGGVWGVLRGEVGDVQGWAEGIERELQVVGETLRLVDEEGAEGEGCGGGGGGGGVSGNGEGPEGSVREGGQLEQGGLEGREQGKKGKERKSSSWLKWW